LDQVVEHVEERRGVGAALLPVDEDPAVRGLEKIPRCEVSVRQATVVSVGGGRERSAKDEGDFGRKHPGSEPGRPSHGFEKEQPGCAIEDPRSSQGAGQEACPSIYPVDLRLESSIAGLVQGDLGNGAWFPRGAEDHGDVSAGVVRPHHRKSSPPGDVRGNQLPNGFGWAVRPWQEAE
jgi:hypothetical protein